MRIICDVCESAPAVLFCAADEAALCRPCDDKGLKMSHTADFEWENLLIDDRSSEEGNPLSGSSDSETMEEELHENNSDFSDALVESDFEVDDALYVENVDDEIELVGIKEAKNVERRHGGVEIRDHASHSMHKSEKRKSPQTQIYQGDANDSDFEFDVGLCFNSASDFRDAVRIYATKQGRPVKFTKNCSDKIQITCDCGWVLFASFISRSEKTFQVKTIKGVHTCYRVPSSKHCKAKFLAQKYEHGLKYTCSNCGERGHNKKGCTMTEASTPSTSTTKFKLPVRRNS